MITNLHEKYLHIYSGYAKKSIPKLKMQHKKIRNEFNE